MDLSLCALPCAQKRIYLRSTDIYLSVAAIPQFLRNALQSASPPWPLFCATFRLLKACPRQQRRIETSAIAAEQQLYVRGIAMRLNGFAVVLVSGLALAGCGGGNKERPATDLAASQVTTIGVNSYLWRASLDALSFMPLLQTDSAGGVIVTDWYVNPNSPGERMKLTVSILDQDLRADALRVAAAREVNQNGQWVSAQTKAATVQKLEAIILTKARDLRRSAIAE
jgi:Domain of unknown function (DUF3576)